MRLSIRPVWALVLLIGTVHAAGAPAPCAYSLNPDRLERHLQQAEARWAQNKPLAAYRVEVSSRGGWEPGRWRLTVQPNGKVLALETLDPARRPGLPLLRPGAMQWLVPGRLFSRVHALINLMRRSSHWACAALDLRYDPTDGHITRYRYDTPFVIDEEIDLTVSARRR